MIIEHFTKVEGWCKKRWPNFKPSEKNIACSCCGEFYLDKEMFDKLQTARIIAGKPLIINSGHRCKKYNKKLEKQGAAKNSTHLEIAFDVSTIGHNRNHLLKCLVLAGFTSFGFYENFIHVDCNGSRLWYGSDKAKELWMKAV